MSYPDKKFEFVYVNPYEGEGSGLLTSISFAQDYLQCPFIFHVCDTILNNKPPEPTYNWMACGKSGKSDLFRTVTTNKNKIIKINEKGEINYDYAYIGIAGINDYRKFWGELKYILNNANLKDSSDCHVFSNLLSSTDIKVHVVDAWHDTGNVESLNNTRKHFNNKYRVLDKYEEAIYFTDHNVIKFFSDNTICKNRVQRSEVLEGLIPKILDSSDNFYKYKLVEGDLLSEVIDEKKLENLIGWAETNLWKSVDTDELDYRQDCKKFYKYKTSSRVKKYLENSGIEDTPEIINGIQVPSCHELLDRVHWESLYNNSPKRIHGDFVMENILYNKGKFTLLDWRQDFGGNLEAGDIYYDLAKLNHNLVINHKLISDKHFSVIVNNGEVTCDLHRSHNLVLYQQFLLDFLERGGYDVKKIKLLTALIWLNMAPLHTYPLNKFLYYFGKYNLWREITK